MVMMAPASATTKPAPAETLTSRILILKPVGRPSLLASSDSEYWVLAMQTGSPAAPRDSISFIAFLAPAVYSTPSAP